MNHLLCEISGSVHNERLVWNTLLEACHRAGAMVVGTVKHSFSPLGFSGVVLLGESHASLHTWPERYVAVLDYFSCAEHPGFVEFLDTFRGAGFTVEKKEEIRR